MTTIYTFDADKIYVGAVECDPWGPVPAGALTVPPELSAGQVAQWQDDAWRVLAERPVVSQTPDLRANIVAATQSRLDAFAQTRNYDSILSAATYASSSVPRFSAEGQAAVDARDATWATLYALMGEVLAGQRPMPASFAEIEPLLPVLEWPV